MDGEWGERREGAESRTGKSWIGSDRRGERGGAKQKLGEAGKRKGKQLRKAILERKGRRK